MPADYTDAQAVTLCNALQAYFTQQLSTIECYVFQAERGEQNQRPHVQGYIMFKSQKRFNAAKTFLSARPLDDTIHLEPSKGSRQDNFAYCSKEPRVSGQPFSLYIRLLFGVLLLCFLCRYLFLW